MNTQPSAPIFITHAQSISIYMMKYVFVFILNMGINSAVCIKSIDETS